MFSKEQHFTSVVAQSLILGLSRIAKDAEKAASEKAKREAVRKGPKKLGLPKNGGKKFQRMATLGR